MSDFASLAQYLHLLFPQKSGGTVITDLQLMTLIHYEQQHLPLAELDTTEDGSVCPGGGTHRVISTYRQSIKSTQGC